MYPKNMYVYKEKKEAFLYKKTSFVILCLGAEPSQFSWTFGGVKNFSPDFFKRVLFPELSDAYYSLYFFPKPLRLPLGRVLVFLHFE